MRTTRTVGWTSWTRRMLAPATTLNAAAALGRSDRVGSLAVGRQADLVIFDVPDYRHLFYHFGVNHVWRVIMRCRVVHAA